MRLFEAFFPGSHRVRVASARIISLVLAFSFFISPFQFAFAQEASIEATPSTTEETPIATPETTPESSASEAPKQDEGAEALPEPEGGGGEGLLDGEEDPVETFEDSRLSHENKPEVSPDENTGSLRYVFPIITPPGRNGLGPDLKLIYDSSNNKNAYFGLGWSDNIPYIERINRTGAEDLYKASFTYFSSSLDGELREVEGGVGGGEGAALEPQIEIPLEIPPISDLIPENPVNEPLLGEGAILGETEEFDATLEVQTSTPTTTEQQAEVEPVESPSASTTPQDTKNNTATTTEPAQESSDTEERLLEIATSIEATSSRKKISDGLIGKSAKELADIKGQEIAKIGPLPRTKRDQYEIEITSISAIDEGVEVFARAWDKNGEQIGFGNDGTVEIERFRFFNPPILVDDPDGDIIREYNHPVTGESTQRKLREDLQEALFRSLEYVISVKQQKFGSDKIVKAKIGNTTSTFYPNDCTATSTSNDGVIFDDATNSSDWNTVHDYTSSPDGGSPHNCSSDDWAAAVGKASNGNWRIARSFFLFNTAALGDSDRIDSATLGIWGTSKTNNIDDGKDWVNVVQTSPASSTVFVNDDYDQAGAIDNPTEGSTRRDITTSWSTGGFNNFLLNATGTAWVSKNGVTKLGIREGHDALDSAFTGAGPLNNYALGYFADQTGTTNDPRLVVEHGSWATPLNTEYGARVENGDFRKYEFIDNEWWRVTDKFGTVYKFGYATTTRQNKDGAATTTFKWMLEEVRDTNDNYISYEYYKDSGQIYPYKIKYTGNGSTDGIYEIEFTRTYNPDIATTTSAGFPIKTYYKISEIQVKSQGDWVRKYALGYANGFKNINLLLATITESGQDEFGASSTLPAYSFEYNPGFDQVWTLNTSFGTSSLDFFVHRDPSDGFLRDYGSRPIDANGDGYSDQIFTACSGPSKWVNLNNTNNGWNGAQWSGSPIPDRFITCENNDNGLRILDVDGNVTPDLARSALVGGSQEKNVYTHRGSSWEGASTYIDIDPIFTQGVRFGDVNGDSLTDFIQGNGTGTRKVYLNRGDETGWAYDANYSVPMDFIDNSSVVVDVNNDGFVDLISASTTGATSSSLVYINKGDGTGWEVNSVYSVPVMFTIDGVDQGVRFADLTNDGYTDYLMSRKNSGSSFRKVYVNNGDGTGWSDYGSVTIPGDFVENGFDYGFRLMDVTGDGILDIVQGLHYSSSDQRKGVYTNSGNFSDTINYPDTLTTITSATGEEIEVKYLTSPLYKATTTTLHNPNLPLVINTVRHIIRNDGVGALATTTYDYGNGAYYFEDLHTRKFAGFATTTVTDALGNKAVTYFHQGTTTDSSIGEYDDRFPKIGKPFRIEMYDASSTLYSTAINRWENTDLGNDRDFVKLTQTVNLAYDGLGTHRDTGSTYAYDNTSGNLTEQIDFGEVTGNDNGTFTDSGTDKKTTTITYAASTTLNILGLPSREQVFDNASSTVRDTKHYYDSLSLGNVSDGNETKTEFWKTASSYASTTRAYNAYGLLTSETDPRSNTTTYTYENANLYIATATNPLSQQTQFYYDYSLGKPKITIDANSRRSETVYDAFDRPTVEYQPDLTTPSTLTTKKTYAYTDTVSSRKIVETSYLSSTTDFTLHTYLDGMDRPIQTRREAEDSNVFSVRDFVYNRLGLLQKESLPYFSSGSAKTSAAATSSLYTSYGYDALKRIATSTNAVGTTTNTYLQWRVVTVDPNGNSKKIEKDAFGRLATVVENNDGTYGTTTYAWNHLDKLTSITDADANVRSFTYDGLGRRLTAQDLHDTGDGTYGTWSYAYDDAGNVSSTTDPKGQTIQYAYDSLNRVKSENYTGKTGTEITYKYDSCSEGKGRLCAATSSDAVANYAYNALGLVATESKNIAGTTYTITNTYDRQGNLTNIVYPDSSEVKYTYNTAGLLETVQQKESGGNFANLASDFDYGPTQQVTYKSISNSTASTYTYDATKLYRLSSIVTTKGATNLQNISYTYDANGNITQITDNSSNGLGKTVVYTYDDLNRLTVASTTAASSTPYRRTYAYSKIGNIASTSDLGTYTYGETNYANPHAPTSINGVTYTYDNNGNLISAGAKAYSWDYRNRLLEVATGTATSSYAYDHANQRARKSSGSVSTHYPNKYFNITSTGTTTRHVFTPSGEMISTITKGGASVVAPQTLYNDSLQTGWSDWSYSSTRDFASTTQVYSGSYSIGVTYTSAYGGLFLNHAGYNTSGSTHLGFQFYSGAVPPGEIIVKMHRADNEELATVNLTTYTGTFSANTWYDVAIPLTDIHAEAAATTTRGFTFISDTATTVFYDNIRFLRITATSTTGTLASEGLASGWSDWSYSSAINFLSTSTVATGLYATEAQYTSAYGGLFINHAGFNTTGSTHVAFQFYSGTSSPGEVIVKMHRADNESLGEVNLTSYTGTLATSTWYEVAIPLTDIHAEAAATTSRGFTFISDTVTTAYFDHIRFISSSTQTNYNQATTTTKYLHVDHLGGTNVVTNSSGNATEVTDYYPYGSPRINSLTSGTAEQRKYIGEHYDTDTNLSYLNARYYEGTRGQFLSQDPVFWEIGETKDGKETLVDPQLANSYSYAGGNPITSKDPTGRFVDKIALALIAPELVPILILATVGSAIIYYATQPANLPDPGSFRAETLKDGGPRFSDPLERGAGDIAFVADKLDGLIGFGAAGEGAHAPGETVDLTSFDRQIKRAALFMTALAQ